MKRKPLVALAVLALGAAVLAAQLRAAVDTTDSLTTITFTLKQQNRSGQSGTATLSQRADGTTIVKLRVSKPVRFPGTAQMAHIHDVTCAKYARLKSFNAKLATVMDPLTTLSRGRSTSYIDVPLAQRSTGGFSINVHAQDYPYPAVVCGNIPKS